MVEIIRQTFFILSIIQGQDRLWLVKLAIILLLISAIEVVGIGALLPYLKMVLDGNKSTIYSQYNFLDFSFEKFIISISLLLIFLFSIKSIFQYYLYKAQYVYIFEFNEKLSLFLTKKYLHLNYKDFINYNTSSLIKNITQEVVGFIQGVLLSLVIIFSEIFVALMMILMMVYIDINISLLISMFMAPLLFLLFKIIKLKLINAGSLREESQDGIYQCANEILSSYKEIHIYNSFDKVFSTLGKALGNYKKSNIIYQVYNQVPKIVLETAVFVIFVLVVLVTFILSYNENELGKLLIFGVAMLRILPSLNRINSAIIRVRFYTPSCKILFDALKTNEIGKRARSSDSSLESYNLKSFGLRDSDFYFGKNLVLNRVNVSINKGDKVAVIGLSGSGKSTLVDLLTGFHEPGYGGKYLINGKDVTYQTYRDRVISKMSLVSQSNFFYDDTLRANINLGSNSDQKDDTKILEMLQEFGMAEFKHSLDLRLGQNSINLSGGQKQRIAIIRALAAEKDIVVLDEATSALDISSQAMILNHITNSDKTLIAITHDISHLRYFDYIMILSKGHIIQFKPYSKIEDYRNYIV